MVAECEEAAEGEGEGAEGEVVVQEELGPSGRKSLG